MSNQIELLKMLQDSVTKLITIVKFTTEKILSDVANNRQAILILEEKVDRLLSIQNTEEIHFETIRNHAELDEFEDDLKENSASYLNFFSKSSFQLSKFLAPEFIATLTLSVIKETLFFNKIFAPLCSKRYLNPDHEITVLTRRAKNLMSKRKSLAKGGGPKKKP